MIRVHIRYLESSTFFKYNIRDMILNSIIEETRKKVYDFLNEGLNEKTIK